ncbi:hypothetical protein [Mesorhizobium sp. LjRoot246]
MSVKSGFIGAIRAQGDGSIWPHQSKQHCSPRNQARRSQSTRNSGA